MNYLKMVKKANEMSKAYYAGNDIATDSEFDALVEEIKKYEKKVKSVKADLKKRHRNRAHFRILRMSNHLSLWLRSS